MKCDFDDCEWPAIRVDADHGLGDGDYHECAYHLHKQAERHEEIAKRLRRAAMGYAKREQSEREGRTG